MLDLSKIKPLDQNFYARDTLVVAKDLIGKIIVRQTPEALMMARIVETEAYVGDDPASHAYQNYLRLKNGKMPTGPREVLFRAPGTIYVYLNYGMYWLFNIVTDKEGEAGGVLIRAGEPLIGEEQMRKARPLVKQSCQLCNGPGKLAIALAIDQSFNGKLAFGTPDLFVGVEQTAPKKFSIAQSGRIGISKAVDRKWRFYVKNHSCVSAF